MLRSLRALSLVVVAGVVMAACSEQSSVTAPGSASFAKSGTAPSGGSGGGGSTTPKDTTTKSPTPTSPTGEPIAPNYVGYITRIGEVPVGFYYGKPSSWDVNGYRFESVYITNYKPVNGAFVLGACVSVNFYMSDTTRIMQEMKTVDPSKCK